MIVCESQITSIGRRVRRVRALPAYPDRSSFDNRPPRGWTALRMAASFMQSPG